MPERETEMSIVKEILEAHASSFSKITARTFIERTEELDDEGASIPPQTYVLLEGDREGLRFLGELILAQVESGYGCTLGLHPVGPGSNHFTGDSTLGIFIHNLPCDLHPGNVVR
jgi:hypothetical protein